MKTKLLMVVIPLLVILLIFSACGSATLAPEPTLEDTAPVSPLPTTQTPASTPDPTPTSALVQSHSISETISLDLVLVRGAVVVAGDGKPIVLINNTSASDPTYDELTKFLLDDLTDVNPYDDLIAPYTTVPLMYNPWNIVDIAYYSTWATFDNQSNEAFPIRTPPRTDRIWHLVCTDFAEIIQNNAELAGIKSAYVIIMFNEGTGHTLNAFATTDRGLVFIDGTGKSYSSSSPNFGSFDDFMSRMGWDKVAQVEVGKPLTFQPVSGNRIWEPLGIVNEIIVQW